MSCTTVVASIETNMLMTSAVMTGRTSPLRAGDAAAAGPVAGTGADEDDDASPAGEAERVDSTAVDTEAPTETDRLTGVNYLRVVDRCQ